MGDRESNRVERGERGREIMSGLDMRQVPPTPPDPWMVDRMDVGSADERSSTNTVRKFGRDGFCLPCSPPSQRER